MYYVSNNNYTYRYVVVLNLIHNCIALVVSSKINTGDVNY